MMRLGSDAVREMQERALRNAVAESPRLADIESADERRAKEQLRDRQARFAQASAVPPRFSLARIENAEVHSGNETAVHAAAYVIAQSFTASLALHGNDVGNGKTHLACAIVNAASEQCVGARFLTAVSIFESMHEASKYGSDEDVTEILREFATIPVLVLDDLGREPLTKRTIPWLGELLNRRWNECRPLVVTTNLSFEQLHKHYAAACAAASQPDSTADGIVDRLRGMIPFERWVKVTGRSQRGRSA